MAMPWTELSPSWSHLPTRRHRAAPKTHVKSRITGVADKVSAGFAAVSASKLVFGVAIVLLAPLALFWLLFLGITLFPLLPVLGAFLPLRAVDFEAIGKRAV